MLVCNIKLNKQNIFKTLLVIMIMISIIIGIIALYKVLTSSNTDEKNLLDDSIPSNTIAELTSENYTNVLNMVHSDIDTYIGQKITFSGYIYRLSGFSKDQFVLARNMDIGNNQSLIVGFLCSSEKASKFEMYSWVKITGEITKGSYNNTDIPIIKITDIEQTSKPENANVMPPDDSFVPTAVIY